MEKALVWERNFERAFRPWAVPRMMPVVMDWEMLRR